MIGRTFARPAVDVTAPGSMVRDHRAVAGYARTGVSALTWALALLAVASLAAGLTLMGWAWVTPDRGPFWSSMPEAEGFMRLLAVVIFGLPAAFVAFVLSALAFVLRSASVADQAGFEPK